MTGTDTARSPRRAARRGIVAVGLLVAGIVLVTTGLRGTSEVLPRPTPSAAAVQAAAVAPVVPRALTTSRSIPVRLRIPTLGMNIQIGTLGLNSDGTVQVPSGTTQPGWFDLGPTPGQLGSAVLLGHVDSYAGPGVFFQLRTLAAGDLVDVDLADGDTAQFTVDSVDQFSKQAFPAERVYGSHGVSALQLVTCGGVFDHQTGSYLSNVVVFTSLTAVTRPT